MPDEPTTDALEILDRTFRDAPEIGPLLDEGRVHARIARQIHARRTELGLTQAELAGRVDTTQSAIARLEDADYEGHSVRMLRKIASALGARLDVYLVPEEEPAASVGQGERVTTSHLGVPADTTPAAAAEQERLFAEMEPSERLRAALELSTAVRQMAIARVKNHNEGLSDAEVRQRIIELCYGGAPQK